MAIVEPEPARDVIFTRLMESIGQLHQDLDRVELWLGALDCFQTPVPDYQPSDRHLLPERREIARRGS
ncbi:MAG: hypothetical protein WA268_04910 [Xanthobacteraceae bacterium]